MDYRALAAARRRRPHSSLSAPAASLPVSEELAAAIASHKPGETVKIALKRAKGNGEYENKTVSVTLGERPNSVPNPNTPEG